MAVQLTYDPVTGDPISAPDPNDDYTPALTTAEEQTILHQRDVEKVIDARVAVLKAAGLT